MNAVKNSNASSTAKPGLARGVTKDTLTAKAKVFVEMGSGEWQAVGRPCDATNGENRTKEFGAWLAYFDGLGMPTRWFEGREAITVPARWPHLFDAEREVQTDYSAAGTWTARMEMERRAEVERPELTPDQRSKVLARIRSRWWPTGKASGPTPQDALSEPQGSPVKGLDIDALVKAHDRDLAEYKARQRAERLAQMNANITNERNG